MNNIRRVAVNRIILDKMTFDGPVVIELVNDRVVDYYKLDKELHSTEWLGGTVKIETHDRYMIAFKDNHRINSKERDNQ